MAHILHTEGRQAPPAAAASSGAPEERPATQRGGGWRQGAVAFAAYAAVSFVLWGVRIAAHIGSRYVSNANVGDERFYTWAMAWWPHAVAHGLDPFHPTVVWAPRGISMAWVTGIPGPAFLLAPLTAIAGPIASVDLLFLAAPALAGWAAYLVCRRLTGRFWPALAGGYLFGLSTYLVDQMRGHLNLVLVFPVPLALYLVLRRLDGDLRRRTFIALLAGDLLLQFSISIEVFATMVVVGVGCGLGALLFGGPRIRSALLSAAAEIGGALGIALVVASPYIVAVLQQHPASTSWPVYRAYLARYSSDLAGTVIPRNFTLVGGHLLDRTSSRFVVSRAEDGSYFGIPLLVALVLAVWSRWRERATWLLAGAFLIILTLSLGPQLYVIGRPSVWLPWSVLGRIPGLSQALPSRLSMYAWLVAAILVARWLAGRSTGVEPSEAGGTRASGRGAVSKAARWALVGLAAVCILPVVPPSATPTVPGFFADGTYRTYLRPGEIVLTLPFTTPDPELLWQVESGFEFRMAGGYVGARAIPPEERSHRAFHGLIWDRPWRIPASALRDYLVEHRVGAVVLDLAVPGEWQRLFGELGLRRELVGGVILYRIPAGFASASP